MGGLIHILAFAALLFFAGAMFTLARADGRTVISTLLFIAAAIVLPAVFVFMASISPSFPIPHDVAFSVAAVVPMLALFALSKSVARKVVAND
ncbi:hypothetical protein [Shimia biformata]|uniref:hypothetical protein n=1 Tax=Shimia biformata TaxID=1294299 RepID=UPI0019517E20|nr:hypothetical protein [Shimia biformata]